MILVTLNQPNQTACEMDPPAENNIMCQLISIVYSTELRQVISTATANINSCPQKPNKRDSLMRIVGRR